MTTGGIVEVNLNMEPEAPISDMVTFVVFQSVPGGNDGAVINHIITPQLPTFVRGWQTVRIPIPVGSGTFEGYVSIIWNTIHK